MTLNNDPITVQIKFELSNLRAQIVKVLTDAQGDTVTLVDEALNKAINEIDFKKEINRIIRETMPVVIEQRVKDVINNVVYSLEARSILQQAIIDGFNKYMENKE